ncbi:MAG TPA: hypothetical protein VE133_14555 [Candidatus Sulfotelmatobacter sp.]|jgi:hypothetical protein|nr:hypothetical protein [Candidatus Sulfotelmatobacter sp.]
MPLLHTNFDWGTFAQPVGTAVRWGLELLREQKSENAVALLAFGPLVVAKVRTKWLDFLQGK